MGSVECECRDYGRDSSKCKLHWYREMDVRRAAEMASGMVLEKLSMAKGKPKPRPKPKPTGY